MNYSRQRFEMALAVKRAAISSETRFPPLSRLKMICFSSEIHVFMTESDVQLNQGSNLSQIFEGHFKGLVIEVRIINSLHSHLAF